MTLKNDNRFCDFAVHGCLYKVDNLYHYKLSSFFFMIIMYEAYLEHICTYFSDSKTIKHPVCICNFYLTFVYVMSRAVTNNYFNHDEFI